MKSTEGRPGRVFILKIEDGDVLPDCIEKFAAEKGISTGSVILVGGVGSGQVVVGPRRTGQVPPEPMLLPVDGAHEVAGVGVIAPDESGKPVLHIHASLGRSGQTMTGCLRYGVSAWLTLEAVVYEITGTKAVRKKDKVTGFTLLDTP